MPRGRPAQMPSELAGFWTQAFCCCSWSDFCATNSLPDDQHCFSLKDSCTLELKARCDAFKKTVKLTDAPACLPDLGNTSAAWAAVFVQQYRTHVGTNSKFSKEFFCVPASTTPARHQAHAEKQLTALAQQLVLALTNRASPVHIGRADLRTVL